MTKSILLKDRHVVSTVLANRPGIASMSKIKDYAEGLAGKVSTAADFDPERDFVVNSIRNVDGRRKLVVLAGSISLADAKKVDGFDSIAENDKASFGPDDIIWLTAGDEPVAISDAVELELIRD